MTKDFNSKRQELEEREAYDSKITKVLTHFNNELKDLEKRCEILRSTINLITELSVSKRLYYSIMEIDEIPSEEWGEEHKTY